MYQLDAEACATLKQMAVRAGQGRYRWQCPGCAHERKNKRDVPLTVTVDHEHLVYRCWHCEAQGAISLREQVVRERWVERPFEPSRPQPKDKGTAIREIGKELDPVAINFLKERGISEASASHYGLTWARAYFPGLGRETHGIALPFYDETGVVKSHKVRSTEDKAHVCKPACYSLFGIQNVDLDESPDLLISEGELDAVALFEAGILNPTSVPNGASSFTRAEGKDERELYAFLWSAKALIDKAKRIIICPDDDEPGNKLAEELARRIGRHRCWRARWPEGCKDAGDVLKRHGPARLKDCVDRAEPWPVEGIYEVTHYEVAVYELFQNGFGDRLITGINPVDELYSPAPGLLTVVTGIPGHGKSTLVDQFMVNLARRYDHVFAICSFENPPEVHIGKLAEMLLHKHFFENKKGIGVRMTEHELHSVMPFITQHFKFLHQDDGKKATLESIMERLRTAVFRWGIHGAVIDPYNYIQRPKSADSETNWIDDMLTQLRLFAAAHGIHLWFVAHPTKLQADSEGNYPPPRGYSISGSNSWYAKADFGLTIYRVPGQPGVVEFINWKTRFDWLGKEGSGRFLYDEQTNVYLSDAIDIPMQTRPEPSRRFSRPRLVYQNMREGDDFYEEE